MIEQGSDIESVVETIVKLHDTDDEGEIIEIASESTQVGGEIDRRAFFEQVDTWGTADGKVDRSELASAFARFNEAGSANERLSDDAATYAELFYHRDDASGVASKR